MFITFLAKYNSLNYELLKGDKKDTRGTSDEKHPL